MDSPGIHAVIEASFDGSRNWPVARRVSLYRQLAEICGCPKEGARFLQLANDLEAADRRCHEFAFAFTRPSSQPHTP